MSITKTLLAGAAGTVLAGGLAVAGEPMKLSTTQMDQVTAGIFVVQALAFPNNLQGISGSFSESLYANGSDTTSIRSLTNFTSTVAGNAGGTATGTGTGGLTSLAGQPLLVEGLFIFGRLQASTFVATNVGVF